MRGQNRGFWPFPVHLWGFQIPLATPRTRIGPGWNFWPERPQKSGPATVSLPEGLEKCLRGQNRGNQSCPIHFWGFETPPEPPWGPKSQNWCIFAGNWGPPLSRVLSDWESFVFWQSCSLMIVGQLLFSSFRIFSLKIFQGGPRPPKHAKFKSKKQKFLDVKFFLHEAYIWTS